MLLDHSLGAWMAFELVGELEARGVEPPALLIVSATCYVATYYVTYYLLCYLLLTMLLTTYYATRGVDPPALLIVSGNRPPHLAGLSHDPSGIAIRLSALPM